MGTAKVQASKEYQQRKNKFYDHILDNKQQSFNHRYTDKIFRLKAEYLSATNISFFSNLTYSPKDQGLFEKQKPKSSI
jgi:hypothetical protein